MEGLKQLYQKRKVLFIRQIERNEVCNYIFAYLKKKYEKTKKFKKNNNSFIKQIMQIEKELKIEIEQYTPKIVIMFI